MRPTGAAFLFPASRTIALSNLASHYFFAAYGDSHRLDLLFDGEERSWRDGRTAGSFDILFVALSYEPSILDAVRYLYRAGIPVLREARPTGRYPFLVAGGVAAALNPLPLLDVFDAVLLGEAEVMHDDLAALIDDPANRAERVAALGYAASAEGPVRMARAEPGSFAVSSHPALITAGNTFGGRAILELDRGCVSGCRFCAARHLYGTLREASRDRIVAAADAALAEGRDIALLGTGLESVSYFDELLDRALVAGRGVSLSSVRIPGLTRERAVRMAAAGVRTLTIAPESMSEKTRSRIGKALSDEALFEAFRIAKEQRFKVKAYLMAGLPESDPLAEASAICDLLSTLKQKDILPSLSISITPFCPKPGTPLADRDLLSKRDYERMRDALQRGLGKLRASIPVEWFSWREAFLQTALDRIGREGSRLLAAYAEGGDLREAERKSGMVLHEYVEGKNAGRL